MTKSLLASALGLACAFAACGSAQAAQLTLINLDPPNVGLNDPTPATPTGSNPGTTVGDQRRIAYQFAADLWGAVLKSEVEVKVYASFAPLACTATSGVLGSAGPNWIVYNFPGADPNVLYHSALGDAIAGEDLMPDPDDPADIASQFNGNLGQPGCLETSRWYYGLDGATPAGSINFLNVVMHEISHGLGFSGFLNKSTGALLAGLPDVYTRVAFDNQQNLRFTDTAMTDALRAAAMRTPGRTVWDGSQVNSEAALILDDLVLLRASGTLSADYVFGTASFGPAATAANFSGTLALANDGVGPDTADACEALPAGSLGGQIAFVNRGTCGFEAKALNAQNAGAIGVLIGNVASSASPGTPPGMADDPAITATLPAVSLALADADAVRAALPGVNVALATVPGRLAGADLSGRTQLYAPTTVAPGSTFSHFDTTLSPNALMEPFITSTLQGQYDVDLTPALFRDEGWQVNGGNARIGDCATLVPTLEDGGLIVGANVVATSNTCEAAAGSGFRKPLQYLQCMLDYSKGARKDGLISAKQKVSVDVCSTHRALELASKLR